MRQTHFLPAALCLAMLPAVCSQLQAQQQPAGAGAGTNGGKPQAGDAGITYVKWTDPKERSFTVDVPDGWSISGGLYHPAIITLRPQIVATSPDGLTHIQVGDSSVPGFTLPDSITANNAFMHRKVGDTVTLSTGLSWVVQPYQSGADFSRTYVQRRFARQFPDLKMGEPLTLTRATDPSIRLTATSGLTSFTYTDHGAPMCGFVVARTAMFEFAGNRGGGLWSCDHDGRGYLFVCTGPNKPGQREKMIAIVEHIDGSFVYDPDWYRGLVMQGQVITRAFTHQVQQQMDDSRAAYKQEQIDRRDRINGTFFLQELGKTINSRYWVNFALDR